MPPQRHNETGTNPQLVRLVEIDASVEECIGYVSSCKKYQLMLNFPVLNWKLCVPPIFFFDLERRQIFARSNLLPSSIGIEEPPG